MRLNRIGRRTLICMGVVLVVAIVLGLARLVRAHEIVDAIDKPEIWLPPVPDLMNETRITDGALTKSGGGHATALQEGIDFGNEPLGCCHGHR